MAGKIKKPSREELKRMYVDEYMSIREIGKRIGMNSNSIWRCFGDYGIKTKDKSESHLPAGVSKPSKQELKRMYIGEHMDSTKIGERIGARRCTVSKWLRDYGIKTRDKSESQLPPGFKKPPKKELKRMYVNEHMSAIEIGKKIGVSNNKVWKLLEDYGIEIRRNRRMTSAEFASSLEKDPAALALAYAATNLNNFGYDFEKIIMEAYDGKFKDQKHLHELLQKNAEQIRELVDNGFTNLGAYIGQYSIEDRRIFPVILEGAIDAVPNEKITASLEERMARILRMSYSPKFNDNPKGTLKELEGKVKSYEGKRKQIYEKLVEHYRDVLKIGEELR